MLGTALVGTQYDRSRFLDPVIQYSDLMLPHSCLLSYDPIFPLQEIILHRLNRYPWLFKELYFPCTIHSLVDDFSRQAPDVLGQNAHPEVPSYKDWVPLSK